MMVATFPIAQADDSGDRIQLENAFILVAASPAVQSKSFIQLPDLITVLDSFFSGSLDEPAEATMICEDLLEWHGNNLWCQIDSGCLESAIATLPKPQRCALYLWHVGGERLESALQRHWSRAETLETLSAYGDRMLLAAYEQLSEILIKELL